MNQDDRNFIIIDDDEDEDDDENRDSGFHQFIRNINYCIDHSESSVDDDSSDYDYDDDEKERAKKKPRISGTVAAEPIIVGDSDDSHVLKELIMTPDNAHKFFLLKAMVPGELYMPAELFSLIVSYMHRCEGCSRIWSYDKLDYCRLCYFRHDRRRLLCPECRFQRTEDEFRYQYCLKHRLDMCEFKERVIKCFTGCRRNNENGCYLVRSSCLKCLTIRPARCFQENCPCLDTVLEYRQ